MGESNPQQSDLSYRERDVDETLDNHERRISRLEKAGLIALGYVVAEMPQVVSEIASFIL